VLAPTHALFERLALAGAVLVLAGGLLGWIISRRITIPLLRVTRAAGALASGDYSPRLHIDREDEIGRLGDAFDAMADRIEEAHSRLDGARAEAESANLAKSRFLAMMSHEIRTPLNAIVGYTEFLKLGIGGPLPQQQRSYVDRMHGSAEHLLALVNDLLDMSSIEADRMRVTSHPSPLAATVREVCDVLESEAHKRSLSLSCRCDDGVWYRGDPSRVRQIVLNLISNAIKFTEPGGSVSLTCDRASDGHASFTEAMGKDWVVVRVRDTGIGITNESLSTIWDPFVQADASHTREHGGTGLGLTISRRLARLMGGDITVESERGAGSVFTLWLPAAATIGNAQSIGAA
jgi:signal transduction histidine kinase